MLSAKLKSELLAAREQREMQRLTVGREVDRTLLQIGLNLPGIDKSPAGGAELLRWALQCCHGLLPAAELLLQGEDLLGPWALLSTSLSAVDVKRRTVVVETQRAAARLLDIDVYDLHGMVVGRREIAVKPRGCLLCSLNAVDCIRLKNHDYSELKVRIDELLAPFRA